MTASSVPPAPHPTSLQRWIIAARPRTLPAASAPVIATIGLALYHGHFRLDPALACLLCALLLQIGANFANDVFDYQKGVDTRDRLGPLRVTQAGLLTQRQVYAGMLVVFGLAALLGVYLAWTAGWPVIAIGVFSILVALAYSGGPYPLGYHGLGEVFVFLFFGLAACCGTYFVLTGAFDPISLWVAVPMGLLTVAILIVNNLRDIETDRATAKRTLAVIFGAEWTRREYIAVIVLAYLAPLLMWVTGSGPVWVLLTYLSIPRALALRKTLYLETGRPLNKALAGTGQLELWYGLLIFAGLVIPLFM
ncbi:MAG TPA: 1,4-dihydroxy-2-naphthoate polyprenyltransferase [Anaerolineaceae bacterium]|nr:1,4-dihydroxy-2-naphthoate polyprenyltransferase [Anaerolineaceae bacterium]